MSGRLQDKVALIIGSARGIGKGIAQRFAEEGARLVLADSEAEAGQATASEFGAAFIRTDISQMNDAEAAVARATRLSLDGYHAEAASIVQHMLAGAASGNAAWAVPGVPGAPTSRACRAHRSWYWWTSSRLRNTRWMSSSGVFIPDVPESMWWIVTFSAMSRAKPSRCCPTVSVSLSLPC